MPLHHIRLKTAALIAAGFLFFSCAGMKTGETVAGGSVLQEMQNAYRNIARTILPVVVEVTAVTEGRSEEDEPWPYQELFPPDEEFEMPSPEEEKSIGIGTGIIFKTDGEFAYIVTNAHVTGDSREITIALYSGETVAAELIGKDARRDIAVLAMPLEGRELGVAVFGDSDSVQTGDLVVAVGTPFGLSSSVTSGIVSAIGRDGPEENINDFIQTDASINQGNSGGPLVNISGEIIGINTWITTQSGGSIGLGFAIPINNVQAVVPELIEFGAVRDGWLGVQVGRPGEQIAGEMNLDEKKGAFVFHILIGSPADAAGILPGDYIVSIDGEAVDDYSDVIRRISNLPLDREIAIELIRGGTAIELNVIIGVRPAEEELPGLNKMFWPGFTVAPVDDLGLRVARVEDQTVGQLRGIHRNDIILEINGRAVTGAGDFYSILNDPANTEFTVLVKRNGGETTIYFNRIGGELE